MAIDKESQKKRNARKVFENTRDNATVKKASDISLNNTSEDVVIEKRKVYDSTSGLFKKKTVVINPNEMTGDQVKKLDKTLNKIDKKALYEKNRKKKFRKAAAETQRLTNNENGNNEDTASKSLEVYRNIGKTGLNQPVKAAKKIASKASAEHYKVIMPDGSVVKGKGSIEQAYSNISQKSNMLKPNTTPTNGKSGKKLTKKQKKKQYKKNRKRIYRAKRNQAKRLAKQKAPVISSIKKKAAKFLIKGAAAVFTFILGNWLLFLPILLVVSLGAGGEAFNQSQQTAQVTYPASDADITKAKTYWQALQVQIKAKLMNVPELEGIAGNFDTKTSNVCEFMNDDNALLSFLSAYYIPYVDAWHFEDAKELIEEVFGKMYVITYSIKDRHLEYNVAEGKSWEDILNEYLNDEQKQRYTGYYEHKGGGIKAFSSPFAFDWSGYITSPFGYRDWGGGDIEFHKGVDFGVPHGTEICSVADGTVVKTYTACTHDYPKDYGCGCGGNYGNYVDVLTDDGQYYITYGHMSDVYVNVGDKVQNGQVVGLVGCTGWSTGNHLHLEFRLGVENGELIDPLTYIQDYVPIEQVQEEKKK